MKPDIPFGILRSNSRRAGASPKNFASDSVIISSFMAPTRETLLRAEDINGYLSQRVTHEQGFGGKTDDAKKEIALAFCIAPTMFCWGS
jgi:hypothetical protein